MENNKAIKLNIELPSFYVVLEEPHDVLSTDEDGKLEEFECCWARFFCSDGDEYHEKAEYLITNGIKELIDTYGYDYPIPHSKAALALNLNTNWKGLGAK